MKSLRCAGTTGATIPPGMTEQEVLRALAIQVGRVESPSTPAKSMRTTTTKEEKTVSCTCNTPSAPTPRRAKDTLPDSYGLGPEYADPDADPGVIQVIAGPPIARRELRQPKATSPDTYGLGEEFTR